MFLIQFLVSFQVSVEPTSCWYNSSGYNCATAWYNATLSVACNVHWYKTSFLPAKYHVFDTISCIFSSECGAYDKLIQFYSLIHCNTFSYNASFFKVRIVQPRNASFYPQNAMFLTQFLVSFQVSVDPTISWYNFTEIGDATAIPSFCGRQ